MNIEEVEQYLGAPYLAGSFGPPEVGFNCWGLLHYVQAKHFGVKMPKAPIGDAETCRRMFTDRIAARVWAQVEQPRHGDGALMREGKNPHVGVYLNIDNGGILHALEGVGVIFTPITDLGFHGFSRVKYYRLNNVDQSSYPP